jgi:hypothetical protein
MVHKLNQRAAVRRCEDLARRRRYPSDSAAPLRIIREDHGTATTGGRG